MEDTSYICLHVYAGRLLNTQPLPWLWLGLGILGKERTEHQPVTPFASSLIFEEAIVICWLALLRYNLEVHPELGETVVCATVS